MTVLMSWIAIILTGAASYLAAWSIVKAQKVQDDIKAHMESKVPLWVKQNGRWVQYDLHANRITREGEQ